MDLKLSVIMSVHNEEQYLKDAVDSILNQTYEEYEFIIINDGSTDRSQEILESYTDNRLRIVKQETLGLTRSLNRGIKFATGEYIARMDGNDISLPERFEKQVEFFNINKKIGLVGSFVEHIDEDGNYIKLYSYPTENDEIKKALWSDCPFCHSSAMFRKECIEKVGYYREKIGPAEDYDLWFRISEHFNVENIAEPFHKVRIKGEGISIDRKFDQIRSSLLVRKLAKERRQYGKDNLDRLTKKELTEILESLLPRTRRNENDVLFSSLIFQAEVSYRTGNVRRSARSLWKSFSLNPVSQRVWVLVLKLILCGLLPPEKFSHLKKIYRDKTQSLPTGRKI